MQRLKDLDWFGPAMPYVQYGGGVLTLLLSSPGAQSSEGSLQAFQAVCFLGVEPIGVQLFPTWGGFPFYSSRWGPLFTYIYHGVLVLPGGPSSSSVGESRSVGQEWRGRVWFFFLGRRVVKMLSRLGQLEWLQHSVGAWRSSCRLVVHTSSACPPLSGLWPGSGTPADGLSLLDSLAWSQSPSANGTVSARS